jgi:excisionase family DNA binding protein
MHKDVSGHLTPREAAERLNIELGYVYQLLWRRKLKGVRVGTRWYIPEESILARELERKENNGRRRNKALR